VGITADATSWGTQEGILFHGSGADGTKIHFLTTDNYSLGMQERMIITQAGHVGIGVANPDEKLVVDGLIKAEEVYLESVTGANYVFETDYALMPLSEVERHIRPNKRLPCISPAREMVSNDVNMGQTQTKLLEKMEELTLYTIEQNQAIKEEHQLNKIQQKYLETQQQYIGSLEQRLSNLVKISQ
jgi:hypothetical protein